MFDTSTESQEELLDNSFFVSKQYDRPGLSSLLSVSEDSQHDRLLPVSWSLLPPPLLPADRLAGQIQTDQSGAEVVIL